MGKKKQQNYETKYDTLVQLFSSVLFWSTYCGIKQDIPERTCITCLF